MFIDPKELKTNVSVVFNFMHFHNFDCVWNTIEFDTWVIQVDDLGGNLFKIQHPEYFK